MNWTDVSIYIVPHSTFLFHIYTPTRTFCCSHHEGHSNMQPSASKSSLPAGPVAPPITAPVAPNSHTVVVDLSGGDSLPGNVADQSDSDSDRDGDSFNNSHQNTNFNNNNSSNSNNNSGSSSSHAASNDNQNPTSTYTAGAIHVSDRLSPPQGAPAVHNPIILQASHSLQHLQQQQQHLLNQHFHGPQHAQVFISAPLYVRTYVWFVFSNLIFFHTRSNSFSSSFNSSNSSFSWPECLGREK